MLRFVQKYCILLFQLLVDCAKYFFTNQKIEKYKNHIIIYMKNKQLLFLVFVIIILLFLIYQYFNKNIETMTYRQDLYISDSNIHGKGLFTSTPLKNDEFVFVGIYNNITISHYGHFINHQKEPNCKIKLENGDFNVYAIKPIKKDEELTVDYDLNPEFIKKSQPEWNL